MSKVNKRKYRIYSGVSYLHDEVWASWRNGRLGIKKEGLDFPNPPIFPIKSRKFLSMSPSESLPSSIDVEDILEIIGDEED